MNERSSMIKYAFIYFRLSFYCCPEETLTLKCSRPKNKSYSQKWFESSSSSSHICSNHRHPHAILIWRLNFPINIHLYAYRCLCDVCVVSGQCVSGEFNVSYLFSDTKYTHCSKLLTAAAKHIDRKTNILTESRGCREVTLPARKNFNRNGVC